jgi:hypothetical protein
MRSVLNKAVSGVLAMAGLGCQAYAGAERETASHALHSGGLMSSPSPSMESSEVISRAAFMLRDAHLPESLAREPMVRPASGQAMSIDQLEIGKLLDMAPMEFTPEASKPLIIQLPNPRGQWQRFAVRRTKLMGEQSAAEFPDIRAVVGQGIDDPHAVLRADVTMHGFRAQVLSPQGDWYIDPITRFNPIDHTSHFARGEATGSLVDWPGVAGIRAEDLQQAASPQARGQGSRVLRVYRIAVTSEFRYTMLTGGSIESAMGEIASIINRVNGVFERDLAVRLEIINNNARLIVLSANTPPFNGGVSENVFFPGFNQTFVDTQIGDDGYDLGVLLLNSTSEAGPVGTVCVPGQKARSIVRGGFGPQPGDSFMFLARQLGRQFGAQFTHNFGNQCFELRNGPTAMEPDGGSTLMSRAGSCGNGLNLSHDAYFHSVSLENIASFLATTGASCGQTIVLNNAPPTVQAATGYTIPSRTPIMLSAIGSDPDGDAVTYCWEARSLGPYAPWGMDDGQSPLVRSRPPVVSNVRYVPPLEDVIENRLTISGELLPQISRTWPWRVTVRDNRAGGGLYASADTVLNVVDTGRSFRFLQPVLGPSNSLLWYIGRTETITWDVAGTDGNGINAQTVAIEYTRDNGLTWLPLVASTPNDGSEPIAVNFPHLSVIRFRVRPTDNVFYAVSGQVFVQGPPVLVPTDPVFATDLTGSSSSNNNGVIEPGERARFRPRVENRGQAPMTNLRGIVTTTTPTVTITWPQVGFITLPVNHSVSPWFEMSISREHPCDAPIDLHFVFNSDGYEWAFSETIRTGSIPAPTINTFSYSGPAVAIGNGQTIELPIAVSALPAMIDNIDVVIGGTSCSTVDGSPTVGLAHTAAGNLEISLISPQGTQVMLSDNRGGLGNNFCGTTFSDSSPTSIQSVTAANAPFSSVYRPESPLAVFRGLPAEGTWRIRITDTTAPDTGVVRAVALQIRVQPPRICRPPANYACPSITQQPQSIAVCPSGSINLAVAASGDNPLRYQWMRNGVNLADDVRISGSQSANLRINSLQASDLGSYTVRVFNLCSPQGVVSNAAIVSSNCFSPSNIGAAGGDAQCDGLLDNNDFIVFINYFFATDARADVGVEGGASGSDGLFDNNDFIVFIDGFFAGC